MGFEGGDPLPRQATEQVTSRFRTLKSTATMHSPLITSYRYVTRVWSVHRFVCDVIMFVYSQTVSRHLLNQFYFIRCIQNPYIIFGFLSLKELGVFWECRMSAHGAETFVSC